MPNLETTYLGLTLKNPIIVGSTGLTKSANKIKACEDAGAGAVVIKSLFEESLRHEDLGLDSSALMHTEAYDYLRAEVNMQYGPVEYCDLIKEAKKTVKIPVIASINCVSPKWWPDFAKKVEAAGADALELNVFPVVVDAINSSANVEQVYLDIMDSVKSNISIPVAMKISMYITALPHLAIQLGRKGLDGLVMFNRFVEPDIDIKEMKLKTTFPFSDGDDINNVLRWIALLSGRVKSDLSATTGIHSSEAIIKLLLAGASTVQLASVLYKKGFKVINERLSDIEKWMKDKKFDKISDFQGKLNFGNIGTPDLYLRSQFMERVRSIE
ncbi:MAG: dihydroorotate dehydrogenase-like protein [Calditrichaceae bacterium]|nr:dihydroorotate dehydrogenase-like protein [Calditrichaceae bacterium]